MEIWQQNLIRSNLPELLDITDCNDSLLAILESTNVFCSEDIQNIKSICIRHSQNRCLYDKLFSRTNSFDILLRSLAETAQSGAFNILNTQDIMMNQAGNFEYNTDNCLGAIRPVKDRRMFKGKFGSRDIAIRKENYKANPATKLNLLNEISLLTKLDCHENILRFFACKIEDILGNVLVGFELCSFNLDQYIREKTISKAVKINILEQLTDCLSYLHSKDILYVNIRPHCILISDVLPHKIRPKFSDFSAATIVSENRLSIIKSERLLENQHWLPGEILTEIQNFEYGKGDIQLGFSADIFALGCLFYYVLHSSHPFGPLFHRTSNIIFKRVNDGLNDKFDSSDKLFYNNVIEKMILYDSGPQISLENITLFFREHVF